MERQSHTGDQGVAVEFGMYYEFASEEIVRSIYDKAAAAQARKEGSGMEGEEGPVAGRLGHN